ncbi:MAG: TonB family protein, partial [Candidatus Saccharibacteria bacterium]|nr:TonB family protein [Candidatus Saccharibacteria bacterium]
MARPFYKFLGRMALMTAAALWTGCNDDSEKTAKSEKRQIAEAPATEAAANAAPENVAEVPQSSLKAKSSSSVVPRFVEQTYVDSGNVFIEISREYGVDEEDSSRTFDEITKRLQRAIPKVKKLYKSYSKYDASALGSCLYRIVIGNDGSVQDVLVDRTNIRSREFVQAIQKLLKKTIVLKSELKSVAFDIEYTLKDEVLAEDASGNFDGFAGCLYGCGSRGRLAKSRGVVMPISDSVFQIATNSSLNVNDIDSVVGIRVRGLEHLYRKYLKKKPDFVGKIVLKLTVDSAGAVKSAKVESSTTDFPEFDSEIVKAVGRWKFKTSGGTSTVTIPFTFVEKY